MNHTICPCCKGSQAQAQYRIHRDPLLTISRCLSCKTVYLENLPHSYNSHLYEYYSKDSGKSISQILSPQTYASYARVLQRISRLTNLRTILDVGCGKGEFLWAAQELGYKTEGLELSSDAVSIGQNLGLPVRHQSLFSDSLDGRSWDLITLFEVIEHVSSPLEMLDRAASLLNPGGIIYLTTPNYNSLDRRLLGTHWDVFHPEHLLYFSSSTLSNHIRHRLPSLRILSVQSNNISHQAINLLLKPLASVIRSNQQGSSSTQSLSPSVDLRTLSSSSPLLYFLKCRLNQLLSLAELGSTTILIAQKVPSV